MITSRSRSLALVLFAVAAACAKHSGNIAGLSAGSPPGFETRTEISTGTGTHADYRIADFDGDGKLDMAVISITGELRILLGNGTSFVGAQEQQIGGLPSWMSGGDFDGDGDQDLVIVRSEANSTDIWLNDGNGTFSPGASIPVGEDALAVAVGDFDADGNRDIAVSRPGSPPLAVAFGDGAGGVQVAEPVPAARRGQGVEYCCRRRHPRRRRRPGGLRSVQRPPGGLRERRGRWLRHRVLRVAGARCSWCRGARRPQRRRPAGHGGVGVQRQPLHGGDPDPRSDRVRRPGWSVRAAVRLRLVRRAGAGASRRWRPSTT